MAIPNAVAPDELIEAEWGNDVVQSFVDVVRRGLVARVTKGSTEGGLGQPEFAISGLLFTTPTTTTDRLYQVSYQLDISASAQPAARSSVNVKLRTTNASGSIQVQQTAYWEVGQGGGPQIHGVFLPIGLAASTSYVLTIVAGDGTYSVASGSWLVCQDIGESGEL